MRHKTVDCIMGATQSNDTQDASDDDEYINAVEQLNNELDIG